MHWKDFFSPEQRKRWKKSDWVVLALCGVLLLVIAMPSGRQGEREEQKGAVPASETSPDDTVVQSEEERYVAYLEEKLEDMLARVDGVGNVKVMVTVSDAGERVVEKDVERDRNVTEETDAAGGSRTVSEDGTREETVYVKTGEETYPYVQKERLPTVVGVVVVAEGGGNPVVVSDISASVQALLPVEVHRIKVVKMCSKEE